MKSNLIYLKKTELFKELENLKDDRFFAVIDSKVKNHLPHWIQSSSYVYWLTEPEQEKCLLSYTEILEFFLEEGITRNCTIYAIGGGATTDLAGFVASSILRGVKWVAIPTTVLGIIDASIGGKVAINMPQGKNLVGSFYAPEKIYIYGEFLASLPEAEWLSGKGEVLKYAFLSKEVFDLIENKAPFEEIAFSCAQFKSGIVERDFKESGERILLNLGHTLGHAFESTLKIPHGQAVAMGLKYLFKIMDLNDALSEWEKLCHKLEIPLEKFDLKSFKAFDLEIFFKYLEQDKKKINSVIKLVLVRKIGDCFVEEVSFKDFKFMIRSCDEFQNI